MDSAVFPSCCEGDAGGDGENRRGEFGGDNDERGVSEETYEICSDSSLAVVSGIGTDVGGDELSVPEERRVGAALLAAA